MLSEVAPIDQLAASLYVSIFSDRLVVSIKDNQKVQSDAA